MGEDKVITLRFKEGNVPDMELYRALSEEKESLGLSMPAHVKSILGRHFAGGGDVHADGCIETCMERMREVVRGELASHGAFVAGIMEKLAGELPSSGEKTEGAKEQEGGTSLPAYSEDFPEGLYGVLEKFI